MKTIKSIFVVEDDPISSFLIKRTLEENDASKQCKEFKNGEEAMNFLISKTNDKSYPDLILLDINMPVMNGWEFLEKFFEIEQCEEIPVVMLTSSINPEDIAKAGLNSLVKGFLSKPINLKKLDEILELK